MRADLRARRDAFLQKIGTVPVVMGILNLTPDSFSDGGRFLAAEAALSHAKRMIAEGCDIVDVGGESTRPEAIPVAEAEELARIESVLSEIAGSLDVPLSIDTYKANVARRALEQGAVVVNDTGGLQKDTVMADVVAVAEAAIVIMHSRPEKDQSIDIMADIRKFFDRSLIIAVNAGIATERILLDPGIAFGKTGRQNAEIIARLDELTDFGRPILIGVSRKKFLGSLTDGVEGGLIGTVAASLAAYAGGASVFRVHDVAEHVAALKVFHAIRQAAPQ